MWTTSKGDSEYSGPKKPKRTLPFEFRPKFTESLDASIMPNEPIRDQWEYLRKMERHFPIKSGQPIEMALVILNSFTEFPN